MNKFKEKLILPEALDKKWGFVFLGVFGLILLTLIINTIITTKTFSFGNLIGYSLFSLAVASLSSLGYFNLKWFSKILIGTAVIGSIYLLIASVVLIDNSWGDLISVATFTVIIVIGAFIGLLVQLGDFVYKFFKK